MSEEALVLPGQTILGADSHTTHFGWLGAFGAGIGRSEVAALWATGELWLRVPETIRVDLTGSLPPGVTAKDLGLWLLTVLGPEAGIYRAVEIGGPGLRTLSVESRMVLPNLLAESGAKNAYHGAGRGGVRLAGPAPGRENRRGFGGLPAARCRPVRIYPDRDAVYEQAHLVDLGRLEPLVAAPHNPANVVPLSQVAGTPVQQAFIGTCTNGRLEDLAAAAAVLRAPGGQVRRVARGTRPAGHPGLERGAAGRAVGRVHRDVRGRGRDDRHAGLRAVHGQPPRYPGRGRNGDQHGEPQLQGPDGQSRTQKSTSPARRSSPRARSWGGSSANLKTWTRFSKPDRGLRETAEKAAMIFSGKAWVYGDDVNTDVIFPGKYTYTIKDEAEMARHALEDLDPAFAGEVQAGRRHRCGAELGVRQQP